ncbi:hypothetical protein M9Y10_003307 [Tritrichomonas musculus]|uniref:Uncharacterized protein n=1 Tax=Tritrichomonas musculus TaxID=1915356 RepID=A0ABR2JP48_9EUKA
MTLPRSCGPRRACSLLYQKMPHQFLPYVNNNSKNIPRIESFTKNYRGINSNENANHPKKENSCNIKSRCSTKNFNGETLVDNEVPKIILLSFNKHIINQEINITPIQELPSPENPKFNSIFKEKIELCNLIFNFSKQNLQMKGKIEKTKALNEIYSLLSDKKRSRLLTDYDKKLIFNMISRNIFEQNYFLSNEKQLTFAIKSDIVEPSWEQLSIVYKILNEFVLLFPEMTSIDLVTIAIHLMNNPDHNERENLAIFLKNYTKVHQDQFEEIWKKVKNAISEVLNGVYSAFCIEPLISYITIIFYSKSSNYSIDYLEEVFYTHLLPLFRLEKLCYFFDNLLNLIVHITNKNIKKMSSTIQFLVRHFPHQNGSKQSLFVSAMTSIVVATKRKELDQIPTVLFDFLALGIKSYNYKLVEGSLNLLFKSNMRPFIYSNLEQAMDTICEPLKWTANCYWEQSIQDQCHNALLMLSNIKIEFMQNCVTKNAEIKSKPRKVQKSNKELAQTWASLARVAFKRYKSINLTDNLHKIQIEFLKEDGSI